MAKSELMKHLNHPSIVRLLLAASCTILSACTHAAPVSPIDQPFAKGASDVSSTESYKPHPASDYPEITPEEMGRRLLKLVDGLKTIEELTLDRVLEQTKLPLRYAPDGRAYVFGLYLPDSGWHYALSYFEDAEAKLKTVRYDFANPANEQADMTPVCGLSFDDYADSLKKIGFTMTTSHDEIGRAIDYSFYRPEVQVIVTERRERIASEGALPRSCVKSVAIHSVD
ncbi:MULTISPECIES: hypothetical protein [unclassified Lysobacter]|uniref:hypothetical protein n=1 Tax=unclassified Lysobacter TaxID=2635362 RepID=UPI001CBFBA08|nr:hypothetical protein [Lysobacter sp. ESA13C]